MTRLKLIVTVATFGSLLIHCIAGPLPGKNITDIGLKSGTCALGDVVYMPGDEFPGSSPCQKCSCAQGNVVCSKEKCEPRPGCKAVHRPDNCCPTYQCECEQEGRVYSNGEKLIDPADPCRVCYCQGGEVVCRKIACFVRDDCRPRLVPGRCCPEYDNCPLRGVSPSTSVSSVPPIEELSVLSSQSPDKPKPEITIKEITPVSEIPVTSSGAKIKEVLLTQTFENTDYHSSKSPLIPREATSEKPLDNKYTDLVENDASPSEIVYSTVVQESVNTPIKTHEVIADPTPSRINLSTQMISNIADEKSAETVAAVLITTKSPAVEEDDTSLFDHNPAFPPIPDDLTVLTNHNGELLPEPNNNEPSLNIHETPTTNETPTTLLIKSTIIPTVEEIYTTLVPETTTIMKENKVEENNVIVNLRAVGNLDIISATDSQNNPEQTKTLDTTTELYKLKSTQDPPVTTMTVNLNISDDAKSSKDNLVVISASQNPFVTQVPFSVTATVDKTQEMIDNTRTFTIIKKTEATTPKEISINEQKDLLEETITFQSLPLITTLKPEPVEVAPNTISRDTTLKGNSFNSYTTEIISVETSTDTVELIKEPDSAISSAAIIDASNSNNTNALNDFITLIGDVASIRDHANKKDDSNEETISESEELLPVNVGYKGKNNLNANSIIGQSKEKAQNKSKIEIEDENESITDVPAVHDKVEPTTQRQLIDNVTQGMPVQKTDTEDIEIISNSYVPTLNRKPTKVILKEDERDVTSSREVVTEDFSMEEYLQTTSTKTPLEENQSEATTISQ